MHFLAFPCHALPFHSMPCLSFPCFDSEGAEPELNIQVPKKHLDTSRFDITFRASEVSLEASRAATRTKVLQWWGELRHFLCLLLMCEFPLLRSYFIIKYSLSATLKHHMGTIHSTYIIKHHTFQIQHITTHWFTWLTQLGLHPQQLASYIIHS